MIESYAFSHKNMHFFQKKKKDPKEIMPSVSVQD